MIHINLLPWRDIAEKKKVKQFLGQLFIALFIGCALCTFFYFKILSDISVYRRKIITLEHKVSSDSTSNYKLMSMMNSDIIAKQINFLERRIDENNFVLDVLFFMGEHVPNAIYLLKVEKKEENVHLHGRALSQESVALFVKELDKHFKDKKALISEVHSVEGEEYNTDFLVTLGRKK